MILNERIVSSNEYNFEAELIEDSLFFFIKRRYAGNDIKVTVKLEEIPELITFLQDIQKDTDKDGMVIKD